MATRIPTIAFFGATGDCAGHCLAYCLRADYTCIALARTPSRLTTSMLAKGVPQSAIDAHLTIIQGNVRDVETVKQTLQIEGSVVDLIVSGIGSVPKLQWSLMPVGLEDNTICQDASKTVLLALQQLRSETKPTILNISTTGISSAAGQPRDVPLAYVPLYHWLLAVPHRDKAVMENNLRAHIQLSDPVIKGYVNIKPSLLLGDQGYGDLEKIRYGTDAEPAIGYGMYKQDVGLFLFEKLIKPGVVGEEFMNRGVSLTF